MWHAGDHCWAKVVVIENAQPEDESTVSLQRALLLVYVHWAGWLAVKTLRQQCVCLCLEAGYTCQTRKNWLQLKGSGAIEWRGLGSDQLESL